METNANQNMDLQPAKDGGNKFVPLMFGLAMVAILAIVGMAFFL